MSRFFGGKSKDKTQKFYVEFLGWIESRGLMGEKYVRPVVDDLRRKHQKWRNAPKLTVQVSKAELKISQDVPEKNKKNKSKNIKFPIIPVEDVTFVSQARHPVTGHPDDIVACIYLGYIPRTKRSVHVHVYRFDSPQTATKYVRMIQGVMGMQEDRLKQVEFSLIARGEIEDPIGTTFVYRPRSSPRDPGIGSSDGMSEPRTDSAPDSAAASTCSTNSFPSDEIEPDLISLRDQMPFESVTDELRQKLSMTAKEGKPLLLPPKDYDTIRRKQGNLENVSTRRCLNTSIVGNMPLSSPRSRNTSDESGIGLDSPRHPRSKRNFRTQITTRIVKILPRLVPEATRTNSSILHNPPGVPWFLGRSKLCCDNRHFPPHTAARVTAADHPLILTVLLKKTIVPYTLESVRMLTSHQLIMTLILITRERHRI
uniref:Uncharacterized protein LOC111135396 n=1 Tax=Crassostrea virginica TaxID=6565 RepID=A0A8B8EMJ3_CRAVI|nr:uncharacterized protein LOC111135396 [Crassostrea virginica]